MAPERMGLKPWSHDNDFKSFYMTPNGWFNNESTNTIPEIQSYDFFYKSTIQTSFWKEMCQKSKIDTTIDFVKYPQILKNWHFLEHFCSKK